MSAQPRDLHVFTMYTGPDTVIAHDSDDAWEVWEKFTGENSDDFPEVWDQLPDDDPLTIWNDAEFDHCDCKAKMAAYEAQRVAFQATLDKLPPVASRRLSAGIPKPPSRHGNGHVKGCLVGADTLTCREWVAKEGRGFLSSTEY